MGSIEKTPEYGQRLLVHYVDEMARRDPYRPYAMMPRAGHDLAAPGTWLTVTFGQVAKAVNYLTRIIADQQADALAAAATSNTHTFPTMAYTAPSDLRYHLLVLANHKAGTQVLFLSPRNTVEGQVRLLEQADCHTVWLPHDRLDTADPWKKRRPDWPLDVFAVPSIEDLLYPEGLVQTLSPPPPHVPFTKTFAEAANDPWAVLHTSGTTGIPKIIVVRHGSVAIGDAFLSDDVQSLRQRCPAYRGAAMPATPWRSWGRSITSRGVLCMFPLFHMAALGATMSFCVFGEMLFILPPSDRPVSGQLVQDLVAHLRPDSIMMAPYIVEEMIKAPEGREALRLVKSIACGGGTLSTPTGDALIDLGVTLYNIIASTESFPYPMATQKDPQLWSYFHFIDELMSCDWRLVEGTDDLYELWFTRKSLSQPPGTVSIFYTFPHLTEWSSRDIYQRHPTKPDHWRYYGRMDNILVFSTGEKLNPLDIELAVVRHRAVKNAMVVGADRFQAGLLLEIHEAHWPANEDEHARLLADIWPHIAAANEDTVAHGRIARNMVAFADPAKPFPVSSKGSVQRGMATALFQDEIDALFQRAAEQDDDGVGLGAAPDGEEPLQLALDPTLAEGIRAALVERLGVSPKLTTDSDFFSVAGMDSLQVMNASRLLRAGLHRGNHSDSDTAAAVKNLDLSTRFFYAHPTPAQLAAYILSAVASASKGTPATDLEDDVEAETEREIEAMKTLIDRYTADFVAAQPGRPPARQQGQTILVTGTTGSLGTYLLDVLLHRCPGVARVVALNRDADGGRARQARVSQSRGLDTSDFDARVRFFQADLAAPRLGLDAATYAALLADVDRIVHNAWPVQFNYSVATFDPSIAGVRHLADFAAAAARVVPLLFVSSISSTGAWDGRPGAPPVPETRLDDLRIASMGYGRSKLVASLVLDAAATATQIPVVHVRLGQVGGPRVSPSDPAADAVWNRHELLPSVIASSVFLGALPESLGPLSAVDWIPSEEAARVLLEFVGACGERGEKDEATRTDLSAGNYYYHCVNPSVVPWSSLMAPIQAFHGRDRVREIVSFEEWVARLAASSDAATVSADALAANPAVKLLDRLQGMLLLAKAGAAQQTFALEQSKARSPMLRTMAPVTAELITEWCRQWKF